MMDINGVVLVGPPGSGKSTIGRVVADATGMIYVSSGDIARRIAQIDEKTSNNLSQGLLADEELMRDELYRVLYHITYKRGTFILDGFPRFPDQILWLEQRFPKLVYVHLDENITDCIDRLMKRGRTDDEIAIILKRMVYYIENTEPMIDILHRHGKIKCACTGRIDTISRYIVDKIKHNIIKGDW